MSAYNRYKGNQFEREMAQALRKVFPDVKTSRAGDRSQDDKGIDLLNTGNFAFQCKNLQKYASINTIEEIQCPPTHIPVLLTRAVRKETMVVLPLSAFLDLLCRTNGKDM